MEGFKGINFKNKSTELSDNALLSMSESSLDYH